MPFGSQEVMQFRTLDPGRVLLNDLLGLARNCLLNHQIIEVDFTSVEHFRARYREDNGKSATYVACTLFAISRTLKQHSNLNSYLQSFPVRRLAVYDDIDIALTVERKNQDTAWVSREIIRKSDKRDFRYFVDALEVVRNGGYREHENRRSDDIFLRLPSLVRRIVMRSYLMTSPSRVQRAFGTCGFTSVGKFGTAITMPLSPRTVTFSLGLIRERPIVRGGSVVPAKTGYITITYDHRVTDGAEVARMGNDLRLFLESFEEREERERASDSRPGRSVSPYGCEDQESCAVA